MHVGGGLEEQFEEAELDQAQEAAKAVQAELDQAREAAKASTLSVETTTTSLDECRRQLDVALADKAQKEEQVALLSGNLEEAEANALALTRQMEAAQGEAGSIQATLEGQLEATREELRALADATAREAADLDEVHDYLRAVARR